MDRYRLQEWLNYVASRAAQVLQSIFRAAEEQRPPLREALSPKFDFLAATSRSGSS